MQDTGNHGIMPTRTDCFEIVAGLILESRYEVSVAAVTAERMM